MNRRRWAGLHWGLRGRLLVAFVLLGAITAAGVAGGIYVQASNVILQKAQDTAVVELTGQVEELFPLHDLPPSQVRLDEIADSLSDRDDTAMAVYGDRASRRSLGPAMISPELRQAVRDGRVAWQRVSYWGEPAVVIGTRLDLTHPNGSPTPSGLEVFTVRSLLPEQQSINRLASMAALTGGLSLVLAMVLALLAANGVLRPVRELGRGAKRLGEGQLATRVEVRGADELADVATTFNETAASLERHVGELRRMEADARRFVADVSHELRTPLAAMTAVADVLDEEAAGLTGDVATAAGLVSQETRNLTRLVNDLVEVSRFDSGAAALALDDVDVAAAVRATLRSRGWVDQVELDLPRDVRARLDPRRLDVIVANLVGNALRHGAPPVTVRLRAEPAWIIVEVGDRGPGVDEQILPHVFSRFFKADTARARSAGSGLGLAIAWENARLHQDGAHRGSLVVANRPDGGALFTLSLPRDARAGAAPESAR
ncbi:two-component system, OmpR family, sensor histidine kinase MtrB [Amycolatopsis marina]|uniref:Sensor-like histidine kinase SenX3 n=1 Tax=Amycolatopsis marina TaxID=490629 RepID=A0A1I1AZ34_9PSEU|nr:HAMP domain-containing sensor histidine kinase [Amycolatopsis marina]SFB43359.1 two-component system, OmpR family, sensor histidine kinase MtrB [Amycolatopsis marina]